MNRFNIKNIRDLYDIKAVTKDGVIEIGSESLVIYKIDPANIIACDEETKFKIYQAYLTTIRGLPQAFQIVISKDKLTLKRQIDEYKNRVKSIENYGLKQTINNYIKDLEEISNVYNLYKTSHYLILQKAKSSDLEVSNVFSNLKEFGVRVERINEEERIKRLLKICLGKEKLE